MFYNNGMMNVYMVVEFDVVIECFILNMGGFGVWDVFGLLVLMVWF